MNGNLFKPRLLQSVLFSIFDVDGKKTMKNKKMAVSLVSGLMQSVILMSLL